MNIYCAKVLQITESKEFNYFSFNSALIFEKYPIRIFTAKYIISTPLIIENPVKSPIVPPIAESWSTNVAPLSLVTLSNVGVSKLILINFRLDLSFSYSKVCWQMNVAVCQICTFVGLMFNRMDGQ